MTPAIDLPKPDILVKERSMKARYDTGKTKIENGEEWHIMFCLTVHYSKAGINYFSGERTTVDHFDVSVVNDLEHPSRSITRFTMGSGLGVERIDHPSNRFSRKKLGQIFVQFKEEIEGIMSIDDPESVLDERELRIRNGVMAYWNGEKA